jgi:hypothetical protein
MDSHGWRLIYHTIVEVSRSMGRLSPRFQYRDVLIVAMFLWSVANDRPLCWACDSRNYYRWFRPRRLPSVSQFSRRLQSSRVATILTEVFCRLAESDRATPICYLDGRPLVVGPCSKDRQARAGRVYGGFARGYKLHVLVSEDRRVLCWSVTALNVDERPVARILLAHVRPRGLVLADGHYDAPYLYEQAADGGGQLLTPLPANAGKGHHHQSPGRLLAIEAWRGVAGYLYGDRIGVEQCLAHQCTFGGGLGPLPTWVRSRLRVERWVGAKLIFYHARLRIRRSVA